ncbi:MAG: Serine acetyltransferase [Candidatus Ordinivivax streblomastigis]|uniref:Serine acetyltransferase n=1 Tax=Candidatus Ordinivivax streblomastigis TaxID=2540710 RepID=A0A5M8NZQ4_9BACT|nr:MAG: Serine acetyltransferase [Candidatus Ordinivivax streblomastigis]
MATTHPIRQTVEKLTNNHSTTYPYIPLHERRIPTASRIQEIMATIHAIVFPGYSGASIVNEDSLVYHTGVYVEKLYNLLSLQILDALFFETLESETVSAREKACKITYAFLETLPHIKYMLSTDVKAMFNSDPAAKSYDEVIFCYPAIRAILNYRIAHELYLMEVPVLPRVISELAHSDTGIDIHPGAQIGEYFSIDHGTGVVIGQTTIIGKYVTLYQGVTLGAKSFVLDSEGHPMDVPRHPIIEDRVTIYSNSSILGRITIGHNTIIGGNIWLTSSVPAYSRILQTKAVSLDLTDGAGI